MQASLAMVQKGGGLRARAPGKKDTAANRWAVRARYRMCTTMCLSRDKGYEIWGYVSNCCSIGLYYRGWRFGLQRKNAAQPPAKVESIRNYRDLKIFQCSRAGSSSPSCPPTSCIAIKGSAVKMLREQPRANKCAETLQPSSSPPSSRPDGNDIALPPRARPASSCPANPVESTSTNK